MSRFRSKYTDPLAMYVARTYPWRSGFARSPFRTAVALRTLLRTNSRCTDSRLSTFRPSCLLTSEALKRSFTPSRRVQRISSSNLLSRRNAAMRAISALGSRSMARIQAQMNCSITERKTWMLKALGERGDQQTTTSMKCVLEALGQRLPVSIYLSAVDIRLQGLAYSAFKGQSFAQKCQMAPVSA